MGDLWPGRWACEKGLVGQRGAFRESVRAVPGALPPWIGVGVDHPRASAAV